METMRIDHIKTEEDHTHVIRIIQKCQKISEHLPRHVWVQH